MKITVSCGSRRVEVSHPGLVGQRLVDFTDGVKACLNAIEKTRGARAEAAYFGKEGQNG